MSGNFSFNLASINIVALSGVEGRKHLYGMVDSQYNFLAGFSTMLGGVFSIDHEVHSKFGLETFDTDHAHKQIRLLVRPERLARMLPTFIRDTEMAFNSKLSSGALDPFHDIYVLFFQFMLRVLGSEEVATNPVLLHSTRELFEMVIGSGTPTSIMFPWLPTWTQFKKLRAGYRLYSLFREIIERRKASGDWKDDGIQVLLDRNESTSMILNTCILFLVAGLAQGGIMMAYLVYYLSLSRKHRDSALDEIKRVSATYASDTSLPLVDQLLDIPFEAWHSEFPFLEASLYESIRIHITFAAFRKNISGRDIVIPHTGEVVPKGSLVMYPYANIHFDSSVYTDPATWDPERFTVRNEDKKVEIGFVGWGARVHPCQGQKLTTLLSNLVTAYFVASFEFHACDKDGNAVYEAPPLDLSLAGTSKPAEDVYIQYSRKPNA